MSRQVRLGDSSGTITDMKNLQTDVGSVLPNELNDINYFLKIKLDIPKILMSTATIHSKRGFSWLALRGNNKFTDNITAINKIIF